jgi:phosphoglycerate dehydrogenase-like enzyme
VGAARVARRGGRRRALPGAHARDRADRRRRGAGGDEADGVPVNIARGGLVDEDALVEALRAGQIAGPGLDAVAVEPLAPESPLWSLPNLIITPHVAPGRDRLGPRLVDSWCENLRRFAEGRPMLGMVDRNAGY